MDQLSISNVDNRGAVSVAGVATADVSYFSGFWVWLMTKPRRKLGTTIFEHFVFIVCVSLKVY